MEQPSLPKPLESKDDGCQSRELRRHNAQHEPVERDTVPATLREVQMDSGKREALLQAFDRPDRRFGKALFLEQLRHTKKEIRQGRKEPQQDNRQDRAVRVRFAEVLYKAQERPNHKELREPRIRGIHTGMLQEMTCGNIL